MKHCNWMVIALAACLATSVRAGGEPVAAEAAPTGEAVVTLSAEQIVARNVQARGGSDAWRRIQSMSLSGLMDAGTPRPLAGPVATTTDPLQAKALARAVARQVAFGNGKQDSASRVVQLPFRMDLARPLKSRLEIQFQGETAVQVYDGAEGWKLRPFLGRHEVEPFNADELRTASQQQALDGPLFDCAAKGTQVTLEGQEPVDGRNAYKLRLALRSGQIRTVWVDAQSFLESKIDGAPRRLDGHMHAVATYFRDYRPVDGVMVAHQLETIVQGVQASQRILIDKVTLNPALDVSRFARPL